MRQSQLAQDHSILLPIYAQVSEEDLTRVVNALKAESSLMNCVAGAFVDEGLMRRNSPAATDVKGLPYSDNRPLHDEFR
jgi:hypothetical protein